MAGLLGVQPALLQPNDQVSRIFIAKLNPIRDPASNVKTIRESFYQHMRRDKLSSGNCLLNCKYQIVAFLKADNGDQQIQTEVKYFYKKK